MIALKTFFHLRLSYEAIGRLVGNVNADCLTDIVASIGFIEHGESHQQIGCTDESEDIGQYSLDDTFHLYLLSSIFVIWGT